jgi:hypothetical protein
LKPVPEICIVVPGSAATGGEPDVGITVIAWSTRNVKTLAGDLSPCLPATLRVYVCPGANVETLNVASKMAPELSITQKDDETSTVAGFDEIEHAPASKFENPVTGVPSEMTECEA